MADTDKMYTSVAAEKKKMQLLKGEFDALDGSKADKATVAAGDYNKVTVNSQGIVTGGSNPTTLAGHGIQDAYTKTEVNGLVDTPHQNYVTVQATDQTTAATDVLPASGQAADTIYRVSNWDGSANNGAGAFDVTVYSEYAWDDVSNPNKYVFLCVKSAIGEVFDISVYNNNATYADLAAALGANGANVPAEIRGGGMSVKFKQIVTPASYTVVKTEGLDSQPTGTEIFSDPDIDSGTYNASQLSAFSALPESTGAGNAVTYWMEVTGDTTTYTSWVITMAHSSDNKYVQYRLMATDWSTALGNWEDVSFSNELKTIVGEPFLIPVTEDGKYVRTNTGVGNVIGDVITLARYCYMRFPVNAGDKVIVNGTGGNSPRLWAFIDSDEKILSVAGESITAVNLELVAPPNAAEVIINTEDKTVFSYYFNKDSIKNQIEELQTADVNTMIASKDWRIAGNVQYDSNEIPVSYDITWADDTSGTVVMSNFNSDVFEYTTTTATYKTKTIVYTQTYDSNGYITNETYVEQ